MAECNLEGGDWCGIWIGIPELRRPSGGGVIAPQLFLSKFAYNGYKVPFAVCAGAIGGAWLASMWAWWLTRHLEWDVRRIRRLRARAESMGKVYAEEDIDASR